MRISSGPFGLVDLKNWWAEEIVNGPNWSAVGARVRAPKELSRKGGPWVSPREIFWKWACKMVASRAFSGLKYCYIATQIKHFFHAKNQNKWFFRNFHHCFYCSFKHLEYISHIDTLHKSRIASVTYPISFNTPWTKRHHSDKKCTHIKCVYIAFLNGVMWDIWDIFRLMLRISTSVNLT